MSEPTEPTVLAEPTVLTEPTEPTGPTHPRLAVHGLHAGYGDAGVLHGVDLVLPSGRIGAVLGPNGAGKSTTCKTLVGLVRAAAGTIAVDGRDVTTAPTWRRARAGMFLVPEGRGVFPGLSVEDNLRLMVNRNTDIASVYERFPALGTRRRQHAGSLSGGEQQMLSLAPMLAEPTELLIADEPMLGLAPRIADQILGVFDDLRVRGTTILLVGESPHGIVDIADQVSLIHAGRMTWSGLASDLDRTVLEQAYFGPDAAGPPRKSVF
ncbi:ABC-type branched-chain amino acid transport system, ATPase component [Parafrankia irregularis]|uniref:ABC-type branched-chain amino acid transport system, ATPase component n=1 Tax=Parafrankia irregularis TaxID=795642 RepID=A0A0S4QNR1_9ACTN|nr:MULTISPECIES: ABC transporter ATP-binding protein [Parafrankia]MBE3200150.1 ABC transporter ATP-binding protein [Parafrankia sp. CH37]CUU56658.1 ABC-type branched-chain amino acid transport system, ATPase component [Parafrankia irregularis]